MRYWQETPSTIQLQSASACFPAFAPVQEVIELDARGGTDDIALDWQVANPLSGILDNYHIYKYELGSAPVLLASQIGARHIDSTTLSAGGDYCYYVEAVDSNNNVIGTSNTDCERFGELQLAVPHQVVPPNSSEVSVPISVVNGNGLCPVGVDILLEYDPAIVAASGVSNTAYAAGYTFESNILQPGQVNIASVSGICQEFSGRGALFDIQFDVIGGEGSISTIEFVHGITATAIFDENDVLNPVDVRLVDGSAQVSVDFVRGDVNGDEAISAIDAYLSLQIASGSWIPTLVQDAACDVNGDRVCNSADSSLILCYAANENWTACGLTTTTLARSAPRASETQVRVGNLNTNGQLPVTLDSSSGIAGGALTFTYDPALLTINGLTTSSTLLDGVTITMDDVAGLLRVAFADKNAIGSLGTLLYLDVTALAPGATVQLAGVQFNDVAGLDWETNLGHPINVSAGVPTAVVSGVISAESPALTPLLFILLTSLTLTSLRRKS